jgi:hypothetical protein
MIKKPKFGKIALVVFLTVLIWVWADLAQDEALTLANTVTIRVATSSDPTKWITFKTEENGDAKPLAVVDSVDLKGPAKKVAEVGRMRETGKLDLRLYLDPKQEGLETEGSQNFNVLRFLQRNDQIKRLGLTVENCEPQKLIVQVQDLVEKPATVQCFDANETPLSGAVIDPAVVKVLVPKDDVPIAKIHLSADEQQRAKTTAIEKTPTVDLAPGQTSDALQSVKVRFSPQGIALTECTVQVTLGICFSTILEGKYQVKLENEADFATVFIRATPAAEQEFKNQDFNIILYIHDSDAEKPGTVIEREVAFNFPPAYVQRGEIKASESNPLKKAKFTLIPVAPDVRPAPAK